MRYTGRPPHLPAALHVRSNGLQLRFSDELDSAEATEAKNYNIEQWNYRWTKSYGSPRYAVRNPEEHGTDSVRIQSVRLSDDRKTVFLEIPSIRLVMGMSIQYNLRAAVGTRMHQEIYNTVNRVPSDRAER